MTTVGVTARQRLDEALRDYVAEVADGAILTDYFVVTASTTMEDIGTGRTMYVWFAPHNQSPHTTLGLLHYATDNAMVVDDE